MFNVTDELQTFLVLYGLGYKMADKGFIDTIKVIMGALSFWMKFI
jgi:hypothetical protein